MTTEDVVLQTNGNWTAIPLTTTATVLYNCAGVDIMLRFGIGSTSNGFKLKPCATMVIDETIYVRPQLKHSGEIPVVKLNVTR